MQRYTHSVCNAIRPLHCCTARARVCLPTLCPFLRGKCVFSTVHKNPSTILSPPFLRFSSHRREYVPAGSENRFFRPSELLSTPSACLHYLPSTRYGCVRTGFRFTLPPGPGVPSEFRSGLFTCRLYTALAEPIRFGGRTFLGNIRNRAVRRQRKGEKIPFFASSGW